MSRTGLPIRARPIASIFCSPPESPAPRFIRSSASTGNSSRHAFERPAAVAPHHAPDDLQVLLDRQVREDAPVVRDVAYAEPGDLERLAPGDMAGP